MHGFASLGELAFAELPLSAQEATTSPFKLLLRDPSAAREFLVELYPFQFGAGTAAFLPSNVEALGLWLAADLSEFTLDGVNVSQWDDLSGYDNHASQGTSVNRPLLTRADNKGNLTLQSEELTTSPWTASATVTEDGTITDGDSNTPKRWKVASGGADWHRAEQAGLVFVDGAAYQVSFLVEDGDVDQAEIFIHDGTNFSRLRLRISTGAQLSKLEDFGTITDGAMTAEGSGYRFSLTFTPTSTETNVRIGIGPGHATSGKFIYASQAASRRSDWDTDYVETGTNSAYPGVGGHAVPHFDGDNDLLTVAADAAIDNLFDGGGYAATVFSLDQVKSPNDWERIFDKGLAGVYVTSESTGTGNLTFWQQFSGDDATWVTASPDQRPILAGRSHLLEIEYNNSDVANDPTIWVDGQTVTLSKISTPTGTRSDDSGNALNLGNDGTNSRELQGKIAEVLLYSSVPSAIEQRKIRDYLMVKYEIVRWTPSEIEGLGLWLAGDLSPRTMNGSNVSQWDDLSGNGNHATQGTGSAQPSLGTVASLTALVFDGVSEYMTIASDASFENPRELTVFFVQHSDTPGTWAHALNQDGGSPNEGWRIQAFSTSEDEVYPLVRTSAGTTELARSTGVFASTPTIYDMRLDNGNFKSHRLRSSVAVQEKTDTYDEGMDGFRANNPLQIAASQTPGSYAAVTIAEILIYARALTDAEIVTVQNYLKSKYAISPS